MTEEIVRDGCPITIITREMKDGAVYVFILENNEKEEIFKCNRDLWDGKCECGFTPEIRDGIIKQIMSLYG